MGPSFAGGFPYLPHVRFLKLLAYVLFGAALLAGSTALAGWLAWEFVLWLIHHSK